MLFHSASQLLTLSGGPQRGSRLGELNIIEDGAVLVKEGIIQAMGQTEIMLKEYPTEEKFELGDRVLMPGFVDSHTHLVWAGDRAREFEQRLEGKSYLEILEEGGGILSTVRASRAASLDEIVAQSLPRVRSAFAHGSTTIETKTGYGLSLEAELKLLEALLILDNLGPWDLAFTFLAAHAIPPEFDGDGEAYTELIVTEMLPGLLDFWKQKGAGRELPFIDVFCETGAFSLAQSRTILEAAKSLAFPLKIHADEFDNLGGVEMAIELGAASADHLVATSQAEITLFGQSDTVAVSLPGTPFGLAEGEYTPAKKIIDANGILAIASDLNPGTAWGENLQFSLALACRYMKLSPAQAIAAVTINAAAAIGREAIVGSIEVGKQADLLILNESDYRHMGYRFGTNLVHKVIKKGIVQDLSKQNL